MAPARAAPRRGGRRRAAAEPAAQEVGGGRAALARLADGYAAVSGYEKPDPPPPPPAASAPAGRPYSSSSPASAQPARSSAYLKLDSNENMAMPRQFQADLLRAARRAVDVREYPLGGEERLARAIARHLRVPASSVGIGSGSDQVLDQLLAAFVAGGRGGRVLATSPTFSFFEDRCRLYSVPVTSVPYSDDMTLDAGALRAACRSFAGGGRRGAPRLLYLDMPNNPTGFQLGRADLEDIATAFDGLVVIDEAYAEFAGYTAVRWTRRIDNLAVVRTFSKSFGLAGLRLGYFAAGGRLAEAYNRAVRYPYPVSSLAIEAGIEALRRSGQAREVADLVRRERARVARELRSHGAFDVFDSSANFVLFDAGGAHRRVHAALAEQGISIRRLGRIGGREGCLRVTIGTREMNSRFLLAVRDLLG